MRSARDVLAPISDLLRISQSAAAVAAAEDAMSVEGLGMEESPLTELPLLEAIIWESAVAAEIEGDHEESVSMASRLTEFGYEAGWELEPKPHIWLRHMGTGQVMRRGTAQS